MNETYQAYINRIAHLTLPATCSTQLQNIQPSPKFSAGQAVDFPGYSVITPPQQDDSTNQSFYTQIAALQQNIVGQLEPGFVVPLPLESYHLTIADLIWEQAYQQAVSENPNFETELQQQITQSFQQYQTPQTSIQWQLLGIAIRPRAIMACMVPKDQASYQAIVNLRQTIYQNAGLIGLGIEQQYDFTAHITLGYFDLIPANLNRAEICVIISQISDRLLDNDPAIMTVNRVELRKFDNMFDYHRQADWAAINF